MLVVDTNIVCYMHDCNASLVVIIIIYLLKRYVTFLNLNHHHYMILSLKIL